MKNWFDLYVKEENKTQELAGFDLIAEIVGQTGLPTEWCSKELLGLIKEEGVKPGEINLDQIKKVLIKHLQKNLFEESQAIEA